MHGTIILYNHIYTKRDTKYNCDMNTHVYKCTACVSNHGQKLLLGGDCVCEHVRVYTDGCVCWAGDRQGSETKTNMFDTM